MNSIIAEVQREDRSGVADEASGLFHGAPTGGTGLVYRDR